jgi:hypothetical protein
MKQYILSKHETANVLVDAEKAETVHALAQLMSWIPSLVIEVESLGAPFAGYDHLPDLPPALSRDQFEELVVSPLLAYVEHNAPAIAACARSARIPGRPDNYVWVVAVRRMADVLETSVFGGRVPR